MSHYEPSQTASEHFPGCHPEDAEAPDTPGHKPVAGQPENCWHCGTETPQGCHCPDCLDNADYIPPTAVYHCPLCKRWWAYMIPRITTITFG